MTRWARGGLWLGWLTGGTAATGAYLLIPHGLGSDVGYDAIGLVSAAMIVVAVRRTRPAHPGLWYLFAGGTAAFVLGDLTFSYYTYGLHREPFPSAADVFYLAAYPMIVAGLLTTVRRRGHHRSGLLDAAIITTGLALPLWSFVMRPILDDASTGLLGRVIGLAYPAADVLILALLCWLFTGPGARTASFWLLAISMILLLGADIGFALVTTFSSYNGGLLDLGWLLSYVTSAAAALHPSGRVLGEPVTGPPARVGRRWLVLLAASFLIAPLLLVVQGTLSPGSVDVVAIGIGGTVLVLLVATRLAALVTRVQQQADHITALALRDDLTGLPNRRMLESHIHAALPEPLQVALVNLSDFRDINDQFGHGTGDLVLTGVAGRLAGVLRERDLLARVGGDEFAVLLPGTVDRTGDELAGRLLTALQRPVEADGQQLLVQASIGLANGHGADAPVEVLRRADVALHAARDAGGNRYVRFRPPLDARARQHARLGAQLRRALDQQQFRLCYQPIVELPHGRPVGVEALLRWHHPDDGLLSPLGFVPVAERTGLIIPIGAWVLRQACAQAAAWQHTLGSAAPGRISVNVSARQLAEPDFPTLVTDVLTATGLAPDQLTIEVTETTVFTGGRSVEALKTLHDHGVRIALDDFGTGHSSLGLLQTCPVTTLKLDKSFVDTITLGGPHIAIAQAVINLSTSLNLTAIAEGVESPDQAVVLHQLGYRYAQGYHFGRPVPADAITSRLSTAPAPA